MMFTNHFKSLNTHVFLYFQLIILGWPAEWYRFVLFVAYVGFEAACPTPAPPPAIFYDVS